MNRTKHILLVSALSILSAIVVVLNVQQERIYHITSNAILSPSTYQAAPNADVISILDGKQEIKPYKSSNQSGQAYVESFSITSPTTALSSSMFASSSPVQGGVSNGNSSLNSNRSVRSSNYNAATTSTLGVSAMAYASKRSNGGNSSSSGSGLVSFKGSFLGSSIFSDNNSGLSVEETTLGSADPGGDPEGDAIPVPDGLFFLLALALAYLVWKMDLVKKIRTSLK